LAAALRNEPNAQVEVVDGDRGELTVLVDGHPVARKGEHLPPVDQVLAAVRGAQPAAVG